MWGQYLKQKSAELNISTPRGKTPRRSRCGAETPRGEVQFKSHVEELQMTSRFFTQVQEDTQKHKAEIEALALEISNFEADQMEECSEMVARVEGFLSSLVDETQVLKQFAWPEDKLSSMREAIKRDAALQRILSQQESMQQRIAALKRDESDWSDAKQV